MTHAAELYRFHTAFVLGFLGFVVVYAIAHLVRRGTGTEADGARSPEIAERRRPRFGGRE